MSREQFLTKRLAERGTELEDLKVAVLEYISEFDNPVPDAVYRRTLRNKLRKLVGAPDEPTPRRR